MWEKRIIRLLHLVRDMASIAWDWLVLKLGIRIIASLHSRIEKDLKDCLFNVTSLIYCIIITWDMLETQDLRPHVSHTSSKSTFRQDSQEVPMHIKVWETLARSILILCSCKLQIWSVYLILSSESPSKKKLFIEATSKVEDRILQHTTENCPKPSLKSVIELASCSVIQIHLIKYHHPKYFSSSFSQ